MIHSSILQDLFWGVWVPKKKTVQAGLLTDNILLGLGWVMTDGIRTAPRVLLNDGGANLSENAVSLRGVYVTP